LDIDQAALFLRINVAAQRARQLMQGAAPKIQSRSRKPAAIAIQEVDDGLVEAFTSAELPEPPEETLLDDEADEDEESDF
jgi:DNA-directed RNA polymerase subunit K/omega